MKRLIILAFALILIGPALLHAQSDEPQQQDQSQYRDVEDGQVLKFVSYVLMPVGMALEWGIMRPLHYLATQTSAKPALSGDQGPSFFAVNNNANKVPPGTFAPNTIDGTNNLQASNNSTTQSPISSDVSKPSSAKPIAPSQSLSGSQPALH
jgi:hypothetical protein